MTLQQAPRIWYLLLSSCLKKLGFRPLKSDPCIYRNDHGVVIGLYVDDLLVFGPTTESVNKVYADLSKFGLVMTNKGFPQTFLGLNIIRDPSDGSITINQAGKIDKLLSDLKMTNTRAVKTPLDPSLPLTKRRPEEKA